MSVRPSSNFAMPITPRPVRDVHGIRVVNVPDRVFAMGGHLTHRAFGDALPRMVRVSSFDIAETPLTEGQYYRITGRRGNPDAPTNHPVTRLTWWDAQAFCDAFNKKFPDAHCALPSEAQWECAMRGEAVDVRAFMGSMNFRSAAELIEYLAQTGEPLESFVRGAVNLKSRIVGNILSPEFTAMIDGSGPVWAWRARGTLSGERADPCFRGLKSVSESARLNGWGISDMGDGVWEWTGDVYDVKADEHLSAINPANPPRDWRDGTPRVARGAPGRFYDPDPRHARGAFRRHYFGQSHKCPDQGMRVVVGSR